MLLRDESTDTGKNQLPTSIFSDFFKNRILMPKRTCCEHPVKHSNSTRLPKGVVFLSIRLSNFFDFSPGRRIRLSDIIGFYRETHRISLDPIGMHRKSSESLSLESDRKLSDVEKRRKVLDCPGSDRNQYIPTFSDIRQLPIGIQ